MKKKLFLITLAVALFVCLFAIGVSAADMFDSEYTDTVTKFYAEDGTTEVKPDWADLTDANATAVIKKSDGTTIRIPLYYIYQTNGSTELRHEIRTGTGSAGFRYDFITNKLGETVNHANLVALDIPEGIKTTSGLNNYTVLEEVVFPLTATAFPKSEKHPALKKVFAKQVENADGTIAGITAVSDYAFKNVTTLEYFGMQLNYATYIGGNSFLNCAIEEVNFEGPFTGMGGAAFSGCSSLTTVRLINTSSKIVSCGKQAFASCTALTSVVMDKFSIGEYAFEKINATTGTLNFVATNVGCVEASAFAASTALRSVDIEGPLTSVAGNVFGNCTGLETIRIYNTESKAATCGDNLLSCGDKATDKPAITSVTLHNIDLGYRALYNLKIDGANISVTGNYTTIGQQALAGCSGITAFNIPSTVTSIGNSAFANCSGITEFNIPSTVTSIGNGAFANCTALTSIEIPEGVTTIGSTAFYKSGITSLHIPASVESLGYQVAELTPITSLTFAENSNLKFIDHRAFMDCDSLVGPVILPDGLEEIDYGIFSGCGKLKAVKIPDSVCRYTENKAMFSGCSSLEYVQLSKNVSVIPDSMFENCTSLKAISIPEGVTSIGSKSLRNCTSLKAVYLPSTLTTLGVSSDGNDKGAFYQSKNIYFVQNEFSVFNGDTLLGDNFVMPGKPEIYYMPSNLNFLGNSEFQNCNQLNSYIVFPVGVTSAAGCTQQGTFQGVGNASAPVTIVFLGDMQEIVIKQQDAGYANISFVFANANDKDLNSITLTIASAGTNKSQSNSYMYFCNGNVTYDLSTFKAPSNTTYTVLETDFAKTVNTEETQPHFHSPRLDKTSDETCTLPAGEFTYCFCGTLMTSDVVEGSEPLGHDSEGADISKYYPTIEVNGDVVTNYFANIIHSFVCQREECQQTIVESQEGTALFTKKGFTAPENSEQPAICHAITVNTDAILEYNKILGAGNEIKYGVVVGKATASGTPVNAQGTSSGDAIVVGFEGTNYSFIQAKITNVPVETGLYCSAYVVDAGVVTYLYEGSVTSTAQVISISAENATLPETTVPSNDEE